MSAEAGLEFIQDTNRAATLLHPLRLEILKCLTEPESASGLAQRLGLPRQRVNYHLRALEKIGLVELVEERRKGNCIERVLRAKARSYLISPDVLGALAADPAHFQDRFSSSYLVAIAARAIREVALLQERAEKAKRRLATFTLQAEVRFASASHQNAFTEELADTVAKLVAKYHDDESAKGRHFRFFIGAYPSITKGGTESSPF